MMISVNMNKPDICRYHWFITCSGACTVRATRDLNLSVTKSFVEYLSDKCSKILANSSAICHHINQNSIKLKSKQFDV